MLKSLQAGRAIAALAVAAFHLSCLQALPQYGGAAPLSRFTDRGTLGVDFFFVLSGFIILYVHGKDIGHPERWVTYIVKRIVRVYPLYWLLSAVMIVAIALGLGSTPIPGSFSEWLTTILLVHVSAFIPPLHQSWTLFYEVLFYGLFSLAILDNRLGLAVLIAWGATVLLMFRYPTSETFLADLSAANNLDFFFGMAAAAAFGTLGRLGASALGCFGVILFAVLLWLDKSGHWIALLQAGYGVAFAAIVAAAAALEARGWMPKMAFLAALGDASYAIYLVHEHAESHLLRALFAMHAGKIFSQTALFALVFAMTAAVGYAVHVAIEKPLLAGIRRSVFAPRRTPASAPSAV